MRIINCKMPFVIFLLAFWLNGCALLAIGAAGAAGGYAISSDGIEGISDKSYDHVWQTASEVLGKQGVIEIQDKTQGKINAKVGGSKIKFQMEQATAKSVIVRVQARRMWRAFPDMNLARRIYSMIMKETDYTRMP